MSQVYDVEGKEGLRQSRGLRLFPVGRAPELTGPRKLAPPLEHDGSSLSKLGLFRTPLHITGNRKPEALLADAG